MNGFLKIAKNIQMHIKLNESKRYSSTGLATICGLTLKLGLASVARQNVTGKRGKEIGTD